jgi:hypothetical protein
MTRDVPVVMGDDVSREEGRRHDIWFGKVFFFHINCKFGYLVI